MTFLSNKTLGNFMAIFRWEVTVISCQSHCEKNLFFLLHYTAPGCASANIDHSQQVASIYFARSTIARVHATSLQGDL